MKRSGASGTHVRLMLGRPPMPVYRMMLLVHRLVSGGICSIQIGLRQILAARGVRRKLSTAELPTAPLNCFLTMDCR
jgi:hypothetical protein